MAIYQANVQYGDLQGIRVGEGVYVMEDNKVYSDRYREDADPEFEMIDDGREIEIAESSLMVALNGIKKSARKISLGSDSAEW
jgi:hypothetical protein